MKATIEEPILIQSKDGTISGYYLDDGTVKINAGSFFKMHEAKSLSSFPRKIRAYLLNNGYVNDGRILKDYIFDSPNSAICALTGCMASGRSCFYTTDNTELGEYLKEHEDKYDTIVNRDEKRDDVTSIDLDTNLEYSPNYSSCEIKVSKVENKTVYDRDVNKAKGALKLANFKCEIDESHETFITKAGTPYMEAHHLIPLAAQEDFENSLDVDANIICLCPICHRKLHYGDKIENELSKLFKKRKELLKESGIVLSYNELISYYK